MKIIGHRGARGLAPENTIASLRKALEHEVDMIEFDVRVTSDNIPVLHHDPAVKVNNKALTIKKHTFKQLLALKDDLIKLSTAMGFIDAKANVYIEVKPGVSVKPVADALRNGFIDNMFAASEIFLASKSQKVLRQLHKELPQAPKIVIEPFSGIRARYRAKQVETKIVSMNRLWLWWGFIRGFKNSDWELYTYTLNDPIKAKRWQHWGLSGVVTDYPDRFQK